MAEHQSFSSWLVICTRSPSPRLHSVPMRRSPAAPSHQQLVFFSNSASSPLASGTQSWYGHPTDLPFVSHFLSACPLTRNAAWPSVFQNRSHYWMIHLICTYLSFSHHFPFLLSSLPLHPYEHFRHCHFFCPHGQYGVDAILGIWNLGTKLQAKEARCGWN